MGFYWLQKSIFVPQGFLVTATVQACMLPSGMTFQSVLVNKITIGNWLYVSYYEEIHNAKQLIYSPVMHTVSFVFPKAQSSTLYRFCTTGKVNGCCHHRSIGLLPGTKSNSIALQAVYVAAICNCLGRQGWNKT